MELSLPEIMTGMIIFQVILIFGLFWKIKTHETSFKHRLSDELEHLQNALEQKWQNSQHVIQERISLGHLNTQQLISDGIQKHMTDVREQMKHSFTLHSTALTGHLQSLNEEIRKQLNNLTQQVQNRLSEGFEKTSSTFLDVVKRLTIIDEAQKKITELSTHVVSLQDVLTDKKARGAFGEVQLSTLISNMLPPSGYRMQHTLSNQKRADCILFLPQPTGNVVIDAKFPLENYQRMMTLDPLSNDRKTLHQQFRNDIQKHIRDIAEKYIIPDETSDGAIMFIPAESIFAEIHSNHPELIALSQRLRVWLVSPSTLMAILTTAKAVLKDDATRKQVNIIQKHLHALAEDFQRFEKRMDKLTRHIDLAHQDASEVNTSAKKISQRFHKIESAELNVPELSEISEEVS